VFAALKRGDAPDAELTMRNHVLAQRDALRELARNHPSRIAP
jgi:DNA-binding GntR family transcriptional regulator